MKLNSNTIMSLSLAVCLTLGVSSCNCKKNSGIVDASATGTAGTGAVGAIAAATAGAVAATAGAVTGTFDAATGSIKYAVGQLFDLALPSGFKMNVGQDSSENKLFKFISGTDAVDADKSKGWTTLDNTNFETGSAKLDVASDVQIKNLAEILKAYPATAIKVGGYTDNTGDAAINKGLSQKRAEAVKAKLIADGAKAEQVEAEGYGAEFPVCAANDTDECKARNRRVDVRITKK